MFVIYGTYQLFKTDKIEGGGLCEACGNWSDLGSYTSWQFFHLYFLPLIPLGRHRYIDFCFLCNRGRMTSPAEARRLALEAMRLAREAGDKGDVAGAIRSALSGARLGCIEPAAELLAQLTLLDVEVVKARGQLAAWRLRWPAAQAAFEQAVLMSPSDAAAHFHLGEALLALRQQEHGLAEMFKAAQLAPKAMDIRLALLRETNRRVLWRQWLAVAEEYVALAAPGSLKPDFLRRLESVRNRITKEDEKHKAADLRLDELDPPNPYAQR